MKHPSWSDTCCIHNWLKVQIKQYHSQILVPGLIRFTFVFKFEEVTAYDSHMSYRVVVDTWSHKYSRSKFTLAPLLFQTLFWCNKPWCRKISRIWRTIVTTRDKWRHCPSGSHPFTTIYESGNRRLHSTICLRFLLWGNKLTLRKKISWGSISDTRTKCLIEQKFLLYTDSAVTYSVATQPDRWKPTLWIKQWQTRITYTLTLHQQIFPNAFTSLLSNQVLRLL